MATRRWSGSSRIRKTCRELWWDSDVAHKFFTLAEANRALPLVQRIVEDVLAVYPHWKDLVDRYGLVAAQARPEWGEPQAQRTPRPRPTRRLGRCTALWACSSTSVASSR